MEKLLSHLASLEIVSTDIDASVKFYTEHFGMRLIEHSDDKAYLRCWGDYYAYSLAIRSGDAPALWSMTWRTESEQALSAAAEKVIAAGVEGEWVDGGFAYGKAFEFVGPYGHRMRLVWDVERYEAPEEYKSTYPDRPERRSSHGAAPRFLDHVTIASVDVDGAAKWYHDVLGFRIMARTQIDGSEKSVFSVVTTNEKSHDLGIVLDHSTTLGRVNHIAFWVDTDVELERVADILIENGTPMEWGPGVHGIGEQHYLYFREPSGLRVEVNSGGYRNYVPDWEANTWMPFDGGMNMWRNSAFPMSIFEAFPSADGVTAAEDAVHPDMRDRLLNS